MSFDDHDIEQYEKATATTGFPFGDRDPAGGYQVGDYVGLIYSDHEHYVFDNPTGFVVAVDEDEITVEVEATIGSDLVFLMARKKAGAPA